MKPAKNNQTFKLTDRVFGEFQKVTLANTGIHLDDTKRAMITSRFSRRLRELGMDSFDQYLACIRDTKHPEYAEFVDTITTNLTYFFREPHHFEKLREHILPSLQATTSTAHPIRIWSAGCSSGQEPYSIAITALNEACAGHRKVKILCTDIDSKMLRQTEHGSYRSAELRGLSDNDKNLWFSKRPDGTVRANPNVRELIFCRYLNLFDPWPIKPYLDVIFCRNVLIYFDIQRQEKLIRGMAKLQKPGATLILGHSETIANCGDVYRRSANTVYERI